MAFQNPGKYSKLCESDADTIIKSLLFDEGLHGQSKHHQVSGLDFTKQKSGSPKQNFTKQISGSPKQNFTKQKSGPPLEFY